MNDLVNSNTATMSSREIAELTGTRKDSVKRTMESLKNKGLIAFTQTVEKGDGRPGEVYHVNKRDSFVVVARLSPEFTAALVDRWQELEAKQPQLPTTYLAALEKLVETEREKQAALAENAKLNTIIDNEFGYSSILRAAAYAGVHEKTFDWRPLKRTTLGLGLEVKQVPSPRYKYQNLYPIKAFEICYPDIDFDDLKPELVPDKYKLALIS